MKALTKHLRNYAAKVLQAADLLDDLGDLAPTIVPAFTDRPIEVERPTRKPMSKAARNRIAKAQRKRWKLFHGGKKAA